MDHPTPQNNSSPADNNQDRILIIKLGAFGDFIQALGPIAAIRRHHPGAHITLLTTKPFVGLAHESGYIDAVWVDARPRWSQPGKWLALSKQLRGGKFTRVYDLQNNDRTSFYFRLFGLKPEWVGIAPGASHRNTSPKRNGGHAFAGHVQTLALAGIHDITFDDLHWVGGDAAKFDIAAPYILLAPGSAARRTEKRWPVCGYGDLAQHLYEHGYQIVVIGTAEETMLGQAIKEACPAAINLCGQTSHADLVALARGAAGAIGNDTGTMHLMAPTGCPAIVLFSQHSNPVRHAPLGPKVHAIQPPDLQTYRLENLLQDMPQNFFRSYAPGV